MNETIGSIETAADEAVWTPESDAAKPDGMFAKAGEKAREYAGVGKDKAACALNDLSSVVDGLADQVTEKLGPQYGDYTRKAADAVSGIATSLQNADVDQLVEDTRKFVREKPAVAIGAAAVVGFLLTRMLRSSGSSSDADA